MINKALSRLCPTANFQVSYASDMVTYTIEWLSPDVVQPTAEELSAEIEILKQEEAVSQVQKARAVAYPSIQDQLDTLYHGGYEAWKATITAVKEEFPKP
jgi:hypothetical protein